MPWLNDKPFQMTTPIFILKRSLAVHRENYKQTLAVKGVQKIDLRHYTNAIKEIEAAIAVLTEHGLSRTEAEGRKSGSKS